MEADGDDIIGRDVVSLEELRHRFGLRHGQGGFRPSEDRRLRPLEAPSLGRGDGLRQ